MNLSGLHLPPLRLPPRLIRGVPGIGPNIWTADATTAPLSMFDPLYLGCDLHGSPVRLTLAYRNLLCGGVADSGKSNGAARSSPTRRSARTSACGSSTASGSSSDSGSRWPRGSSGRSCRTRSTL